MSYPKTEAPYTERGYFDSTPVEFNLQPQADGVLLSWSNLPFTAGSVAHMAVVGKEYGSIAAPFQTTNADAPRECSGQKMSCIPHPNGQPAADVWDPSKCYSGIWDSVIAFVNYQSAGVTSIKIPYNKFLLAGNGVAMQTDGQEAQYYVELTQIVGTSAVKTKWVFNYMTPVADFAACGAGEVVVPPPPPVVTPDPDGGNKGKDRRFGGKD